MQLHQPEVLDKLASLDAQLLIVSFAALPHLQKWLPHFKANFLEPSYESRNLMIDENVFQRSQFLADPALTAYHAYGLGRNSLLKVYGPRILWQYVRWAIQGKPIKRPAEDPLQRGGDFVVGRDGRLTFAHLGRDQSDRPPVTAILGALSER